MTREKFVKKKRREMDRLWSEGFLNSAAKDLIEELLLYVNNPVGLDGEFLNDKDVFDFHNNLMTIQGDSLSDEPQAELNERERKYIKNWLESKGFTVVSEGK